MRTVVGAAGQGYMPLERGRTSESSLNGGPAKEKREILELLLNGIPS